MRRPLRVATLLVPILALPSPIPTAEAAHPSVKDVRLDATIARIDQKPAQRATAAAYGAGCQAGVLIAADALREGAHDPSLADETREKFALTLRALLDYVDSEECGKWGVKYEEEARSVGKASGPKEP